VFEHAKSLLAFVGLCITLSHMNFRQSSVSFVISAGCVIGLLAACASDARPTTDSTDSDLIGGREALAGEFAGALLIKDDCSATKVGPRQILTAAHCIDTHLSVGSTIEVTQSVATGGFAMQAPTWQPVTITQVDIAPTWVEGCATSGACAGAHVVGEKAIDDIALLTVDTDVEGDEVAVDLNPVKAGDSVIIAGYGCEESVGGSWDYKNQRLRVAETTALDFEAAVHPGSYVTKEDVASGAVKSGEGVRFATPGPDYTLVTDWRAGGTALTADGGVDEAGAAIPAVDSGAPVADPSVGGLCPGDSGGPVLRRVNDKLVLVGVNSSYTFARGYEYTLDDGTTFRYGGAPATNLHARVDAHAIGKWLKGLGVSTTCSAKTCE